MSTNEQLAIKARTDKQALEQLWLQNKPFIAGICKRYTQEPYFPPEFDAEGRVTGVSPDLMNEAFIILDACVKDYDPECGYSFLTHLKKRIEWRFLRLMQNQSLVKIPEYLLSLRKKYRQYQDDYYKQHGSYPSDKEACETLQISQKRLEQIKGIDMPIVSLDSPMNGTEDVESLYIVLDDTTAAELDECITAIYHSQVWEAIGKVLRDRELEILKQRYIHGLSLDAIGRKHGITRERTRQIIDTSLTKIRTNGSCVRELSIDGETAKRGYYLGGISAFKNSLFTSSTEKQAIRNTEKYFRRKHNRQRMRQEDIDQLEQELISVFGDVV